MEDVISEEEAAVLAGPMLTNLNDHLFTDDPSKKSQAWQDLHASLSNSCDFPTGQGYNEYGGFCAWNSLEQNSEGLAYPTEAVRASVMDYSPPERYRFDRTGKKWRRKQQPAAKDDKSSLSLLSLGRHSESRAVQREFLKSENDWFNNSAEEVTNKVFDHRKQLVLPKVGSYKPTQASQSKNFSTNILQNFLKGNLGTSRTAVTPFLPPIISQTVPKPHLLSRYQKPARFRCQLPPTTSSRTETSGSPKAASATENGGKGQIEGTVVKSDRTHSALTGNNNNNTGNGTNMTARWKSSIPRELQATIKTENVIRKDKMSKRSDIHRVFRVGDNK